MPKHHQVCDSIQCVFVLVPRLPVVIQPYLAKIDALVAAWLPGIEGQGVAIVLYGDYGFTGKDMVQEYNTFSL
ncbi:lysosomal beta glucosidase-like [Trifolium medium]|uniref:beta-glucosidase n=1 Tax=Trifolium medium TaxID=97028 RepID=A0A392MDQ2_9FABA|nr:lysosomal beta glucosidase-like [Trifolium medium]